MARQWEAGRLWTRYSNDVAIDSEPTGKVEREKCAARPRRPQMICGPVVTSGKGSAEPDYATEILTKYPNKKARVLVAIANDILHGEPIFP
jgi:hypothetical protein